MASSRAPNGPNAPAAIWHNKPQSVLTSPAPAQQVRSYNAPQPQQGYLPNGAVPARQAPLPGATPLLPNQGRVIQTGAIRVLCIADVRGTFAATLVAALLWPNKNTGTSRI